MQTEIRYSHKIIYTVGIYCLMFICAVCSTTQGVLLTDFIEYYHLESFKQGLVSAMQSIGNLAALFIVGLLLAKMAKKYVLMIVAVVVPLTFFLFGSVPPFALLLFGYFVYGVVFGFLDTLASSMMADLYADNSNVFMNLLHAVYGVGGLSGPVFLAFFRNKDMVWNNMLMATGAFACAATLIYTGATFITRRMKTGAAGGQEHIGLKDMTGFLKEKRKALLLLSSVMYGAHQVGITVWMTRYISDFLGAASMGAFAVSVFWGTVFLSRLILPHVKLGKIRSLIICNLVSCAAIAAGVLSENPLIMMIGIGISGIAEGTVLPTELDIACHWDMERTALGSSMVLIAHYIGFIIAPILIGWLASHISITAGVITPAIFAFLGAGIAFPLLRGNDTNEQINTIE